MTKKHFIDDEKGESRYDLIKDGDSLVSACYKSSGTPIQTYDDGFGNIYIFGNSMGIYGIVRAQTWEDAYSICEDEFFPEADETIEEIVKEYGFKREHHKVIRSAVSIPVDERPDGLGAQRPRSRGHLPQQRSRDRPRKVRHDWRSALREIPAAAEGQAHLRPANHSLVYFGGSQSSMRLPSGSMIQPNLPYADSSIFGSTRTPSFFNAASVRRRLATRKLNMKGFRLGLK